MSSSLTVSIPGEPVGVNQTYARGRNRKTGKPVFYKRKGAKDYQERVRSLAKAAALEHGFKPLLGPVDVCITLWNVKHDIDASTKIFLDSLEGIGYEDDKQVIRLQVNSDQCGAFCGVVLNVRPA